MESVFDFSQESDLKERLWEKMQEKVKQIAPAKQEVASARHEVDFESLGNHTAKAKPAAPARKSPESKTKDKGFGKS